MARLHDSIIFDLDGTLWDSSTACALGWTEGVQEILLNDKQFSPEDLGKIMGLTFDDAVKVLVPEATAAERAKIGPHCYQREIEAIQRHGATLYEGVAQGLIALAAEYPLYLVSNCLEDYLALFLQSSALGKLFKDSECHGRTGLAKAENIKLVIDRNQLQRAAYVGDTAGDQKSAILAGATYYHVNYGFGQPAVSCPRFDTFSDLTKFFLADSR